MGSRQLFFDMYNVSSLASNKQRLASAYDVSPFVALARALAGITGHAEHPPTHRGRLRSGQYSMHHPSLDQRLADVL